MMNEINQINELNKQNNIDNINKNNNYDITWILIINLLVVIVGLIIGMGLGYFLFKKYDYKGPDSNVVINEIYIDSDGKKYKWVPKVCICPISYSMDKLKDPNYIDSGH